MPMLRDLKALRSLTLVGTKVTDKGIADLHSLQALRELWVPEGVTEACLSKLKQALPLCDVLRRCSDY